jgi:hypothetical protein
MAQVGTAYVVRDAGTPSRLGKIYKVYPYTLNALLEAMDDARLRSFSAGPQVVVRVNRAERIVFRLYEHGQEVPLNGPPGGFQ